jgi:hypothetical protein
MLLRNSQQKIFSNSNFITFEFHSISMSEFLTVAVEWNLVARYIVFVQNFIKIRQSLQKLLERLSHGHDDNHSLLFLKQANYSKIILIDANSQTSPVNFYMYFNGYFGQCTSFSGPFHETILL